LTAGDERIHGWRSDMWERAGRSAFALFEAEKSWRFRPPPRRVGLEALY
jgi:hypothetical protein